MTPLDLSEGALFAGEYRVVRPLAQGGMGAVHLVEQESTGRQRALKVMHPHLVAEARQRGRFVQEAQIGGLVDSDHVVEVIAAGVDEATTIEDHAVGSADTLPSLPSAPARPPAAPRRSGGDVGRTIALMGVLGLGFMAVIGAVLIAAVFFSRC